VRALLPFLFLVAVLTACNTPKPTAVDSIEVLAEVGANGNSATALDIVFVYDVNAGALLPKNGVEWFEKKKALIADLADGIDVVAVEIPPATTLTLPLPPRYKKSIGVVSFANYLSASGQMAGNLTPYKRIAIRLAPDNIVYAKTP